MYAFTRGGLVVASYDDLTVIRPAVGERAIPLASTSGLVKSGPRPAPGMPDARAFAEPTPTVQLLQDYAATRKWLKATDGITVGGVTIATDEASQAKIAQLKQAFDAGALTGGVTFKAASGFVTMDAAQLGAIYAALVTHVQACYAAEAQAAAGITAVPPGITTFDQVDAVFAAF